MAKPPRQMGEKDSEQRASLLTADEREALYELMTDAERGRYASEKQVAALWDRYCQ